MTGEGQRPGSFSEFGQLAPHLRYVERASRKLARSTFYAMARWQGRLERKQGLQGQIATFDQQIGQLNEQQQKIDTLQQRLTARVEAFRSQKEMVKAQYGAAQLDAGQTSAALATQQQAAQLRPADVGIQEQLRRRRKPL